MRAPADRFSVGRRRRTRTRSSERVRFCPLAPAADPARGPCHQSRQTYFSFATWLRTDAPDRAERLVCAARRRARTRAVRAISDPAKILSGAPVPQAARLEAPTAGSHREQQDRGAIMLTLSAIVITRNEARNIEDCLDALAFCDERIVVDSGSSDDTVQKAKAKGARVVTHEWRGFGAQKNYALSLATCDWVLSIDADERVTQPLAAEIKAAVASAEADGYEMPRLSSFCGRPMRHAGWFPDRVLRLFRRGRARFSDDTVHERVICEGRVARLSEPLMHEPVLRLEDALSRMD